MQAVTYFHGLLGVSITLLDILCYIMHVREFHSFLIQYVKKKLVQRQRQIVLLLHYILLILFYGR